MLFLWKHLVVGVMDLKKIFLINAETEMRWSFGHDCSDFSKKFLTSAYLVLEMAILNPILSGTRKKLHILSMSRNYWCRYALASRHVPTKCFAVHTNFWFLSRHVFS